MLIKAGSTSRTITCRAFDATTGLPYSSAAYNSSGIDLWYRRGATGAKVAITPATQTVTGAWSSGGLVAIDDNAVRLDLPDAALAAGVDDVEIGGAATAWTLICPAIQLVGFDPRTELTTAALANLDAAISTRSTYAGADTAGTATLLTRITALMQTKAEADTAHGLLATAADLATVAGYLDTEIATILAAVDTEVAAIKAKTDNLPSDPADQSQVEAAITAAQGALAILIGALNDIAAADVWAALDDASANKVADHVLRRSWATAAGSTDGDTLAFRSLLGAVAKLVNRVGIVGDMLTVYEDDDTTALGAQTLTSDAGAEPVTGVNTI